MGCHDVGQGARVRYRGGNYPWIQPGVLCPCTVLPMGGHDPAGFHLGVYWHVTKSPWGYLYLPSYPGCGCWAEHPVTPNS